jgi:adenylate cyclase
MIVGAIAVILLSGALGAWGFVRGHSSGGNLGAITRVAVMPLRDISGSDAVFAESLQDALITGIAGMDLAGVVPRSELSEKGQSRRIRDVASEFKVDAVMEGTLFRAGDVMRINLQLVEPVSVRHYWTGSFELNVKNVLGAQDSLMRTINGQLRGVLAGEPRKIASANPGRE